LLLLVQKEIRTGGSEALVYGADNMPGTMWCSPVLNISGSKGKPWETKESIKRFEMGARSWGSVCKGPEEPWLFASALNHGLPWKVSA
jgi:hypothetical protein